MEADLEECTFGRPIDRLLLEETNHRVANEVSAALAAVHLARSAKGTGSHDRMMETAISRLESFGECSRVLATADRGEADVGEMVGRICRAMTRSRVGPVPERVILDLPAIKVSGVTAHRTALIAHELVTNALKYAFRHPGGDLEVRLATDRKGIVLSVADDGPGFAPGGAPVSGSHRLGGRIVAELVRISGGSLEYDTGPAGTTVRVAMPVQLHAW